MTLKYVRLALGTVAGGIVCAAVVFVAASGENLDSTDIAGKGDQLSPVGTTYVQPTRPAITFASTVTVSPTAIDGSGPTSLATPLATVDPRYAAPPVTECRHWDLCLPMTQALHPPDHQ